MYRNPKHKKTEFLKTYVNEIQKEDFEKAADKLGLEPAVLLRECVLRVSHFVNSQKKELASPPKRASDFIEVNPKGHVFISENFRLCRAA